MIIEELSKSSASTKASLAAVENMVGQMFVANFRAAKIALENANDKEISPEDRKLELLHAKQMFELAYEQFSGIPAFANYKADVALNIAFCNVALKRVSRAKHWLIVAEQDFQQFLFFDAKTIYEDADMYGRYNKTNAYKIKGKLFGSGVLITAMTFFSGGLAVIPAAAFTAWAGREALKEGEKLVEKRNLRDKVLEKQDEAKQEVVIINDLVAELPAATEEKEEMLPPSAE